MAEPIPPTLAEACGAFHQRLKEGERLECPVCERETQIYRRRLHAEMALNLLRLVMEAARRPAGDYLHVRMFVRGGRSAGKASTDASYLVHWGLVERHPKQRGCYRPTPNGVLFAKGEIAVPSHLSLYDNRRVGASETLITIRTAFGKRFDYDELMRATPEVNAPTQKVD